ncbi:Hypothetical protein ORPV_816 [Orpheovirus IHUMI-LCC2]|uniref:Uncharacterized protein n=1 Tax=Orpheovirus IHUMI-LCC2 TaxID=2023057 RepID=A0A2I2L5E2_9VIRU|nr:Hypothetical protein ORPV_816 [Orpheovirus IHUMI-LCC2]SNW62720.1 Hypothetical protein ORPV_816 [Orpheovirus IHUMI-LCC2]
MSAPRPSYSQISNILDREPLPEDPLAAKELNQISRTQLATGSSLGADDILLGDMNKIYWDMRYPIENAKLYLFGNYYPITNDMWNYFKSITIPTFRSITIVYPGNNNVDIIPYTSPKDISVYDILITIDDWAKNRQFMEPTEFAGFVKLGNQYIVKINYGSDQYLVDADLDILEQLGEQSLYLS